MSRIIGSSLLAACLVACTPQEGAEGDLGGYYLPSYLSVDSGASEAQALALASALQIGDPSALLRADGALSYIDTERFNRLPTRPIAPVDGQPDENGRQTAPSEDQIDLEALRSLVVLDDEQATRAASAILALAGLLPAEAVPAIGHTRFEGYEGDVKVVSAEIATKVGWQRELDGIPLIGPGAKTQIDLDSEGAVTYLLHAQRTLALGPEVEIVPPEEALALCERRMGPSATVTDAELVYYAPPLEQAVGRILPHYVCRGQLDSDTDIRSQFVPAVLDLPRVDIEIATNGSEIDAEASVRGGSAPYTYTWVSSSGTPLSEHDSADVSYVARPRQPLETLTLTVTDADGLVTTASETVAVPVLAGVPTDRRGTPYGTVGLEWIGGGCSNLPNMASNTSGFASRFASAGLSPTFNWGEWDAWEIDFKDASYSGADSSMVDNVDLVFYGGHANGTGFQFCSQQSDGWLHHTESRWGNDYNLEWLVVAACGPLQNDGGAWVNRWYQAFGGLHMILSYANVSYDTTIEGSRFSDYLLRSSPLTLLDAWAATAQEAQPTGVTWAVMGPANASWVAVNYNDYYWGMGPTGSDEYAPPAFWRLEGDCL